MSEITLCDSVNNFEMERSDMISKTGFVEDTLSFNDNCIYTGFSKTDFSNLSSKDKAIALYYTPNNSKTKNDILNINSINNTLRLGNEKYPHSQWSNSNIILSDSSNHSNEVLDSLAQSMKLYNDDVSLMIKDLFSNTQGIDLAVNDIDNFFKYSLIIGKNECSISEKILSSIRELSGKLANKIQEVSELQQKLALSSYTHYETNLRKAAVDLEFSNKKTILRNDDFNKECISHLEILKEQMDNNKSYYENQVKDLLNEIRQRDELLDCYQKRENYLFNTYYPMLIEKYEKNDLNEIQNKENIINELYQKLSEVENAFQEELKIKNKIIQEIKNQMISNENSYFESLKDKEDIINKLTQQFREKERNYQDEIDQYRSRSSAQAKLAEHIRSQIQSQQIEYCKKIEDMQQNLDSRGKIIAYVQNKLNIRENELKIANIKFTTAERQMNIEKDQYKREITNLKDELEKTNVDIEELENELDTLEDSLITEHKEELDRLEKEHDFQLNKLWNIIDQRENTINDMENQMEDLKEKIKNLEKALSKYEGVNDECVQEGLINDEEIEMNEKSSITVTGDTSEEIILIDEYYSDNSKINDQINYNQNIFTSELVNKCKINDPMNYSISSELASEAEEYERTELTTTEENEGANSLTLTEDVSEENEIEERKEINEKEEERENCDLENNLRMVKEENEQLKCQLDLVETDNIKLSCQLQQEKDNLKQEIEKRTEQQQEYDTLALKYNQVLNEKEEIKNRCYVLENESKKRKENEQKLTVSIEKQAMEFKKERESFEICLNQLKESMKNTISLSKYTSLQSELQKALDEINEKRKEKNYLKQKLANQYEKNKSLVELIKRERAQSKAEVKHLKQSYVKQNGKIKVILKQIKDGLVMPDHIDLDRIVKRMKSERLLMNNEYERLKMVASSLSVKSASIKQSFGMNNEIPLKYKGSRKDLNRSNENSIEIKVKNPNTSKIQNENKILIKVTPNFEPLQDESFVSKQANDSLNSIESIEDIQELEEFNLKKALNLQDNVNGSDDEENDQNSFVDFTNSLTTYGLEEKKEKKEDKEEIQANYGKDNVLLIHNDGTNKITQQPINLNSRKLQIPSVFSFNVKRNGNFEVDDSNFSITSDNSFLKESDECFDKKKSKRLESLPSKRVRYKTYPKAEFRGNNHATLRRMPNFDHIGKLTQIKIKHSTKETVV